MQIRTLSPRTQSRPSLGACEATASHVQTCAPVAIRSKALRACAVSWSGSVTPDAGVNLWTYRGHPPASRSVAMIAALLKRESPSPSPRA
ncbi:hypothetical protein [Streptomyces microflavus]|uniref:hypothetical protein n=1 Tax=Streptomyces microflavus TaxID=1919 RepID=UPI003B20CF62